MLTSDQAVFEYIGLFNKKSNYKIIIDSNYCFWRPQLVAVFSYGISPKYSISFSRIMPEVCSTFSTAS